MTYGCTHMSVSASGAAEALDVVGAPVLIVQSARGPAGYVTVERAICCCSSLLQLRVTMRRCGQPLVLCDKQSSVTSRTHPGILCAARAPIRRSIGGSQQQDDKREHVRLLNPMPLPLAVRLRHVAPIENYARCLISLIASSDSRGSAYRTTGTIVSTRYTAMCDAFPPRHSRIWTAGCYIRELPLVFASHNSLHSG